MVDMVHDCGRRVASHQLERDRTALHQSAIRQLDDLAGPAGEDVDRQTLVLGVEPVSAPLGMGIVQGGHEEFDIRESIGELPKNLQLKRPNAMDFVIPRSRQDRYLNTFIGLPTFEEPFIQTVFRDTVKEWMPHKGSPHSMLSKPILFEWQVA